MSTSERGGTQFKEFTGINTNKTKYNFIAPNQVSQQKLQNFIKICPKVFEISE